MHSLLHMQKLKTWKHNRFEACKKNNLQTATRSLPPGTNGTAAAMQMLQVINDDKKRVAQLCGQQCKQLWLEAAAVCALTFQCPSTPGRRLACQKLGDIGQAWKQDSGATNCKRIAFIFDCCGTELHRRALSSSHQEATTSYVMTMLGVDMDVQPADMRRGQKTCVQQQHGNTAHDMKNNLLRMGEQHHRGRVNIERGNVGSKRNWKRPKHVFFTVRGDASDRSRKVEEEVSAESQETQSCRMSPNPSVV